MSDATTQSIGRLISETQERDAIHMAVAPVFCGDKSLAPATHVGLVFDTMNKIASAIVTPQIGIIDPFLRVPVRQGERCWLFLYPQTITSLRHEWTHPAFAAATVVEEREPRRGLSLSGVPTVDVAALARKQDTMAAPPIVTERTLDIAWLTEFAEEFELTYDGLLRAADNWLEMGDYKTCYGFDTPERAYQDNDEFWRRYERVVGRAVVEHKRRTFFSCSC